jgi:uncharacterized protein (DUF433 family)
MNTMERATELKHIEATPGVCGGKPRIVGHRIRVQDIVIEHDNWCQSPAEIVANHPGITLADVHAALAYYHDHRDRIQRDLQEDRAYIERFSRENADRVLTFTVDSHDARPAHVPIGRGCFSVHTYS